MVVQHVAVPGGRLAFEVGGGPGPTVLLLTGQSLAPETLHGLRDDLAPWFRVLLVHTRGTGAGDVVPGEWTTGTFAADAVAALDAAGTPRAHVVGFSMGGRVAQVLAARHPDRVDRLVLGATGPGGVHEVPRDPQVSRALRHTASPEGRAALLDLFFSPAWTAANPAVAARFTPTGSPRVRRAHHAASTGHDGWDLLPAVRAPALVLHGAHDAMTPVGNAALLAARLPAARLEVLDGARHGYLEEFRATASALVRAFLSAGAPGPDGAGTPKPVDAP